MNEFKIWVERPDGDRYFDIDAVLRVWVKRERDRWVNRILLEEHQKCFRGYISENEIRKIKDYNDKLIKNRRKGRFIRFAKKL